MMKHEKMSKKKNKIANKLINEKLENYKLKKDLKRREEDNKDIREKLCKYYNKVQDNDIILICNTIRRDNLVCELKIEVSHLMHFQLEDRCLGKVIQNIDKTFYLKLVMGQKEKETS